MLHTHTNTHMNSGSCPANCCLWFKLLLTIAGPKYGEGGGGGGRPPPPPHHWLDWVVYLFNEYFNAIVFVGRFSFFIPPTPHTLCLHLLIIYYYYYYPLVLLWPSFIIQNKIEVVATMENEFKNENNHKPAAAFLFCLFLSFPKLWECEGGRGESGGGEESSSESKFVANQLKSRKPLNAWKSLTTNWRPFKGIKGCCST